MTVLCPRLHQLPNSLDPLHYRHRRDLHAPHKRQLHTLSRRPTSDLSPESAESLFLDALARASLCRKHARPISSLTRPPPPPSHPPRTARFSTHSRKNDPPYTSALELSVQDPPDSVSVGIPREELRSIVDQYDYAGYQEERPPDRDCNDNPKPDMPVSHPNYIPYRDPLVAEGFLEQQAIDYFKVLLQDKDMPNNLLYKAYKALPQPRVQYLQNSHIRKFMHRLSVVEYKDEPSMMRYLSVVDDMFANEIPMTRTEWNSAISFAGRYLRRVGDIQVETATQIWLRMEKEAGIQSSAVTFSILFDIATKAGKFALADIVVKEMNQRNIEPNRYFRTNKIYCQGLRRDGEAVRASYKELVDSGELVDTVVLNCVIASLINAGEASAAEHIFGRMKGLSTDKSATANIRGWKAQRQLGKVLDRAARNLRHEPERRSTVQDATPVTPNLHTYRLLIKYHAHESGNIDRISELLDEMHYMAIPIHGSIFYQLLRGFFFHGGIRYSSWNKSKLDKLWDLFRQYVEKDKETEQNHQEWMSEEDRGCYFDVSIVKVVLRAYHKVTGKDTTMQVWEEIKEVWKPDAQDEEDVNTELAYLFA